MLKATKLKKMIFLFSHLILVSKKVSFPKIFYLQSWSFLRCCIRQKSKCPNRLKDHLLLFSSSALSEMYFWQTLHLMSMELLIQNATWSLYAINLCLVALNKFTKFSSFSKYKTTKVYQNSIPLNTLNSLLFVTWRGSFLGSRIC